MRTIAGKLLRRSSRDWREISLAYKYLLLAWWRLSIRRDRLDHWIFDDDAPVGVTGLPDETDRKEIIRSSGWVNAAARFPFLWARCLQRSLALCLLLEDRGFTGRLKIGVRKNGGNLEAHAWVEYYGRVLNDSQTVSRDFTPMNGTQEMTSPQELSRVIKG